MGIPTKTPMLIDAPAEPAPTALATQGDNFTSMVERLAINPAVDVAKLERLMEMQRSIMRDNAKAEFDAAFAQMQAELPIISKQGEIVVDGRVRNTYARNEDIQEAIRPVITKYGFALRHRHEQLENGRLKIIGILSHRSGHSEQDEFVTAPDNGGKMNDIQRIGSARSYGARYTTLALLNIATTDEDDDGQAAGAIEPPKAPPGWDSWWLDLQAVASHGQVELEKAWKGSRGDYRKHLVETNNSAWEALKRKASAVKPVTA